MEEFIEHQELTQVKDFDVKYLTIGMCGEVGEVCNEIKKIERDDGGVLTDKRLERIKLELGDVLWYYVGICNTLGIDFNNILELNYKKLRSYDDYKAIVEYNKKKKASN